MICPCNECRLLRAKVEADLAKEILVPHNDGFRLWFGSEYTMHSSWEHLEGSDEWKSVAGLTCSFSGHSFRGGPGYGTNWFIFVTLEWSLGPMTKSARKVGP